MMPRILLVNPPIYDFAAYDFWLKPYGMLRAAGMLRGKAEMFLFDFLDRLHPAMPPASGPGRQGAGPYPWCETPKPAVFSRVPRRYKRFGLPRAVFRSFLADCRTADFIIINGAMTYWYPGIDEVLEDVHEQAPGAKTVIGGTYPFLCPEHCRSRKPDLVLDGQDLSPLWKLLGFCGDAGQPPLWEAYPRLNTGTLRLTEGCPYSCSYCAVKRIHPAFKGRDPEEIAAECRLLAQCGAKDVALYDDALLADRKKFLEPFLRRLRQEEFSFVLHAPNALHARLLDRSTADLLVQGGFGRIYLGLESISARWLERTGGKLEAHQAAAAVQALRASGFNTADIGAYIMLAHPLFDLQQVEESAAAAHALGLRIMLAEFSPIPGTPDGELCRKYVDLDEPLCHNKTAFPYALLGGDKVNEIKRRVHELNEKLGSDPPGDEALSERST